MSYITINTLKPFTGWVLDSLVRESADSINQTLKWNVFNASRRELIHPRVLRSTLFPFRSELAFFTHFQTYLRIAERGFLQKSRKRIFFTHFDEQVNFTTHQMQLFGMVEKVFVQNQLMKLRLISMGFSPDRVFMAPGAIERSQFFPRLKPVRDEYVLLAGDFKTRKNPGLISDVILGMPHIRFIIHGKNREIFPSRLFEQAANLRWLDFKLENQPILMRDASLFLSLSKLEGGPIPILESLASGTPVLATETGFARDFVKKDFGEIIPCSVDAEHVISSINRCLNLKSKVWKYDLLEGSLTWPELGLNFFR
jgi:glycosyltransferase involved in cell wall biosynthesis